MVEKKYDMLYLHEISDKLMFKKKAEIKGGSLKISYRNIDKEQFKALYKKYYNDVFNHLYFCSNNYELSRDFTQETFLKLWNQRDKIKECESVLPYLITIAKNLLNDQYRHSKVEQKFVEHKKHTHKVSEDPEDKYNAKLLEEKIRDVVYNNLNNKTRAIFIMSRFEGKSNDNIAAELGIAKKTVENQIHKATVIIRKKIKYYL